MTLKSGRLQLLTPHYLRSRVLRPGLIKLSLRLGLAQQMPAWAKLQFLNAGVTPATLDEVLSRINSLESWVDEWEAMGKRREAAGALALEQGDTRAAAEHFFQASAAFNFAQYVLFIDISRKRVLHESCVRAFASAAPYLDPPAERVEIPFRRRTIVGYLRLPRGARPAPVVVLFNGTNGVKEELHKWTDPFLARGLAVLTFDGPGLGQTWHNMKLLADPRPVGDAILGFLESRLDVDAGAVSFLGKSLGGYLAIRMAANDARIRAVAAVSAPYSVDIYWNITLASMRHELATIYGTDEATMAAWVDRITLAEALPKLECPLLVAGGGRDIITPGREAWRIFEAANCERELIYYPTGAHDCFNVADDLLPRMSEWIGRQLGALRPVADGAEDGVPVWMAAEAVDADFAQALRGDDDAGPRWSGRAGATDGATPASSIAPRAPGLVRPAVNGNGHVAAPRWPWLPLNGAPRATKVVYRRVVPPRIQPAAVRAR